MQKASKVLNAVNQELTLWCEGQAKAGIAITSMTGVNTLSFFGSTDGLQFNPLGVGAYPSATPPASVVTTATATGNYEVGTQNYKFIRVQLTTGSGPVTVVMVASEDGAYQEAFISAQTMGVTLGVVYPSTTSSSGLNTMTIPSQANRAINLTFLEVSQAGTGATQGANAQLRIWDGAVGNGVPLYSCYLAPPVGSVGISAEIALPRDEERNVSLLGTPGNVMTVQIVNLGFVTAIMNARVTYK